jgi:hypothetical protein
MTGVFPHPGGFMRVVQYSLAALILVFASTSIASSSSENVVVDDVIIYYAVLPAEMLRGYPAGSDEGRMHGGVPNGRHVHHVQIALFDSQTNTRITDARVSATVSEAGLAETRIELEPFVIGDALTYGAYFEFSNLTRYQIDIRAVLPDSGRVIEHKFEFKHH